MTRRQTGVFLLLATALLVIEAGAVALVTGGTANNTGPRDAAVALAIITGAAVGIERVLEGCWTAVGLTRGSWWPINLVAQRADEMVSSVNQAVQPVYDAATSELATIKPDVELIEAKIKEIKDAIANHQKDLQDQLAELGELAPDDQRVAAIAGTSSRALDELLRKYGQVLPSINTAVDDADAAIKGTTDFVATFKDNPGRRLISIYVGAIIGLLVAGMLRLNLFQAAGGSSSTLPLGVVVTGLVIGLGSNPTHEVIRAVQEYKRGQKLDNHAKARDAHEAPAPESARSARSRANPGGAA